MSNSMNVDSIDFKHYNEAAEWVKDLLAKYGGIYLTETNGIMNVWLMNPHALLELPPDLGSVVAETIDRFAADVIPTAAIARSLSTAFTGRHTNVPTIVQLQSALHGQLVEHVDLAAVYHQLEVTLIHALYDYAESR